MRFVRQIIADRLSGGVLALLIAFMLLLDGAIGAHAQAKMVAAEHASATEIICSADPGSHQRQHDHGGKGERPECCSAACQFAAQFAATALPNIPLPQWPLPLRDRKITWDAPSATLRPAGLFRVARGPPTFSI